LQLIHEVKEESVCAGVKGGKKAAIRQNGRGKKQIALRARQRRFRRLNAATLSDKDCDFYRLDNKLTIR